MNLNIAQHSLVGMILRYKSKPWERFKVVSVASGSHECIWLVGAGKTEENESPRVTYKPYFELFEIDPDQTDGPIDRQNPSFSQQRTNEHYRAMVILKHIQDRPHLNHSKLAESSGIGYWTVGKMLPKLARSDLVYKSPAGEQRHVYSLTPMGMLYLDAFTIDLDKALQVPGWKL